MKFQVGEASIMEYLKDAIEGKTVLPAFQRNYVWDEEQVTNFALSFLNREYVGNIIRAKLNENIAITTRYLPFIRQIKKIFGMDKEENSGEWLLIDGQQRLATLAFLFYNDFLMINVKRGRSKKDENLFVFGKFFNKDEFMISDTVYEELKSFDTKIQRHLWMVKYEEEADSWKAVDVYPLTYKDIEDLVEKHKKIGDFVEELILKENEKNGNGTVIFPIFALRYRGSEYLKKTSVDINLRKLLEKISKKGKNKKFVKFSEYLADEFRFPSEGITYAEILKVEDIEELAELYEKLNTSLVRLGYYDILKAAFMKIKYSRGNPLDIDEIIDNVIENDKNVGIKALSKCVKNPKEYFIRGFNLWFEINKKKSTKIELGLKRTLKQKQYSKKLSVYENIKTYYQRAEDLERDMKEYAKRLEEFIRKFDRLTNLVSFCSERNEKLNGGIYLYGASAINTSKESYKSSFEIEKVEFFARLYLRFLFLEGSYFRHPDIIFLGKDVNKFTEVPSSPSGDEEYMRKILPDNTFKYYSNKKILEIIDEIERFISESKECKDIHLIVGTNDFKVLLVVQSLIGYTKGLRNILTLDGKQVKNLSDVSEEEKLKFDDVDIHHIFPRSKNASERNNLFNLSLLSKKSNKKFKDKEPKDYWNAIPKVNLIYNLIPEGDWYCKNTESAPSAYLKRAPKEECEFWRERAKLFVDALKCIFGLCSC